MKRMLKLRNRSVETTTIDGLMAVKQTRGRSATAAYQSLASSVPGAVAAAPSNEGATTFVQGGWYFAPTREGLLFAARSGSSLPGMEAVREVSVLPSGRMVVTGDTLNVKLSAAVDPGEAIARLTNDGLNIVRRLPFENAYQVRTTNAESALDAAMRLSDLAHYEFAEPNFQEAIGHRWRPADPDYARQWQWRNSGAGGGMPGADANLESAWDLTRGTRADGSKVRIAVIDNGIDVSHPDLSAAITHGGHYEEDGTGATSFVPWHQNSSFPDGDHGTFCSGMALARTNGKGGCGAAPEAFFIPIACLDDQIGSQATLASALVYAALPSGEEPGRSNDEGADVIACSLGPNGADWDLTSVLELAINRVIAEGRGGKGTPIFWAVSNGHFPISRDEVVSHPSVIKVGRSNRMDLHDGSAFGPELDFLAPGAAVFSTRSGGGYGVNTGTSFAAPLAAGVGALVLAQHPNDTWAQLRDRLRAGCDKVGAFPYPNGRNDEYGHGRVNARASM